MKYTGIISLVLGLMLLSLPPAVSYAGGPGFDNDVKNWKDDDDCDYDDECEEDDNGDNDWNDDDSNEIPLDGGLSLLGIAGVAYGIKRLRDMKMK